MSPSKQGKRWRSEPSPTPHYHGTQNRIRLPLQKAPSFKSQFQNCLLIVHVCILYQGRFFIFFQRQLHIQSFTGINPDVTKTKQQAQFLHQPKQGTKTSGKNFHLDFTPAHPPFPSCTYLALLCAHAPPTSQWLHWPCRHGQGRPPHAGLGSCAEPQEKLAWAPRGEMEGCGTDRSQSTQSDLWSCIAQMVAFKRQFSTKKPESHIPNLKTQSMIEPWFLLKVYSKSPS